jgi:hypothetical protein
MSKIFFLTLALLYAPAFAGKEPKKTLQSDNKQEKMEMEIEQQDEVELLLSKISQQDALTQQDEFEEPVLFKLSQRAVNKTAAFEIKKFLSAQSLLRIAQTSKELFNFFLAVDKKHPAIRFSETRNNLETTYASYMIKKTKTLARFPKLSLSTIQTKEFITSYLNNAPTTMDVIKMQPVLLSLNGFMIGSQSFEELSAVVSHPHVVLSFNNVSTNNLFIRISPLIFENPNFTQKTICFTEKKMCLDEKVSDSHFALLKKCVELSRTPSISVPFSYGRSPESMKKICEFLDATHAKSINLFDSPNIFAFNSAEAFTNIAKPFLETLTKHLMAEESQNKKVPSFQNMVLDCDFPSCLIPQLFKTLSLWPKLKSLTFKKDVYKHQPTGYNQIADTNSDIQQAASQCILPVLDLTPIKNLETLTLDSPHFLPGFQLKHNNLSHLICRFNWSVFCYTHPHTAIAFQHRILKNLSQLTAFSLPMTKMIDSFNTQKDMLSKGDLFFSLMESIGAELKNLKKLDISYLIFSAEALEKTPQITQLFSFFPQVETLVLRAEPLLFETVSEVEIQDFEAFSPLQSPKNRSNSKNNLCAKISKLSIYDRHPFPFAQNENSFSTPPANQPLECLDDLAGKTNDSEKELISHYKIDSSGRFMGPNFLLTQDQLKAQQQNFIDSLAQMKSLKKIILCSKTPVFDEKTLGNAQQKLSHLTVELMPQTNHNF